MFKLLVYITSRAYGDPLTYEDTVIRSPLANASTPERHVAAFCVESLAKEFNVWVPEYRQFSNLGCMASREVWRKREAKAKHINLISLHHPARKVRVEFGTNTSRVSRDGDGIGPYLLDCNPLDCTINGMRVEPSIGNIIYTAFRDVQKNWQALQEAAAAAKRQMEQNEKMWNLAEDLLNMKRNENGALVPKIKVE